MSEDRLELEQELLLTRTKAQMINKYIDELEENEILTKQWQKTTQELERYKNNIKSAFEVINTQMKNLSKEEAENLRIIKFNLIKGSCTFEDLKTEEDYKY